MIDERLRQFDLAWALADLQLTALVEALGRLRRNCRTQSAHAARRTGRWSAHRGRFGHDTARADTALPNWAERYREVAEARSG
jgi:hypothetical protein